MDNKIKYVLNGKTTYYTEAELKEYYENLLKNNGVYFEEDFENDFKKLLKILVKYNGDPHGWIKGKKNWKMYHELEAQGEIIISR